MIKSILFLTFLSVLTGCSNSFLDENLTSTSYPIGTSNIYISPDWPSLEYQFMLESLKVGDFEVISQPSWLITQTNSGTLSDGIGTIECSATTNSDYSTPGIYMDFMTISVSSNKIKIPVGYINEGNPTASVQSTLSLSYNSGSTFSLPIQNTGNGILMWRIQSMPEWLELDTAQLDFDGIYITEYSYYNITLTINTSLSQAGSLSGAIVLATNDKQNPEVSTYVTLDMGSPQLSIYKDKINFLPDETSKSLEFSNYGDGILTWEFADIPEWLTITPSSGITQPYNSSGDIVFICDKSKLSDGQNTAIVTLKTNDDTKSAYEITVTATTTGDNANKFAIEGEIIDAVFNKNTSTLYYTTSSPSKFIAYNISAQTIINELELSKSPTCLAISEDWTKAAIGHNGYMSAIDLSSNTLTAIYSLDYAVNDISWAENDWFCYTQKGGSSCGLHWINITDGSSYDDPDDNRLDGSSVVKKVPGQSYLIATRNATSPSGFFAYDIATKSKKSYAHMSLTNFWFSENGEYVFARNRDVYRTSSSTESDETFNNTINAIATIETEYNSYYGLEYVYHSNNNLWVIQNVSYSD